MFTFTGIPTEATTVDKIFGLTNATVRKAVAEA
jgi:hypothetical protein